MTIKSRNVRGKEYRADLLADLENDLSYAAEYLSAAMSDSKEAFLVALRDVAEAQQGIATLAHRAKVNRESLYRTLSERGNPRLGTLSSLLDTLGFRIVIQEGSAQHGNARKAPVQAIDFDDPSQKLSAAHFEQETGFDILLGEGFSSTATCPSLRANQYTDIPVCLLIDAGATAMGDGYGK